jgi:methyl-accepting chemotaxis protein
MQQSLQQADRGAAVIQTTGELLADVVHGVAAINDKTVQIASAAEEQSTVAEQINENITRISDISQHTSSGAEETAVTAAELAKLAEQLQAMINRFRLAA